MNQRQSLGNFVSQNNRSKEGIFDTPKRDLTPLWRKQNQQFSQNKINEFVKDIQYNYNGDNIIKFNTLPDLNLEQNNNYESLQSTEYFYEKDEKLVELNEINQKALKTDQASKSPNNRIILKFPNQNEFPSTTKYNVSSYTLKPFHEKAYDCYRKLEIQINFSNQWECFAPLEHIPNQICRIQREDELYNLKGDQVKDYFESLEQVCEAIKQHLVAQSLLKLYQALIKESKLNLPETQFQYSNILLFEKIDANQFWIAERNQTSQLVKYNGPNGEIYTGPQKNINISIDFEFLNAFSYFTYKLSKNYFMILNIQGQGSLLTEPQFIFSRGRKIRDQFSNNYASINTGKQYFNYIEEYFANLEKNKN